jgi:hypothetical protein
MNQNTIPVYCNMMCVSFAVSTASYLFHNQIFTISIDTVKVRLQIQGQKAEMGKDFKPSYIGMFHFIKTIHAQEGLISLGRVYLREYRDRLFCRY